MAVYPLIVTIEVVMKEGDPGTEKSRRGSIGDVGRVDDTFMKMMGGSRVNGRRVECIVVRDDLMTSAEVS